MTLPVKGDIVINPQTQRPVKVGSRTWLNLVKKGIFKGEYQPKRDQISCNTPANSPLDKKSKLKARKSAKIASRVISNNIEELSHADNLTETLEQLILRELQGGYTDEEIEDLPKLKLTRQPNKRRQKYYEPESETESESESETKEEYYE